MKHLIEDGDGHIMGFTMHTRSYPDCRMFTKMNPHVRRSSLIHLDLHREVKQAIQAVISSSRENLN